MAEDEYMFCVNTLNDIRKLSNDLKGKNRVQRIVLFFHFTMLRSKFTPVYTEESNEEGGEGSSTAQQTLNKNNDPAVKAGWNSSSDVFHFQYAHPSLNNSSSIIHMKILPMDNLLLVHSSFSSPSLSPSLLSLEVKFLFLLSLF